MTAGVILALATVGRLAAPAPGDSRAAGIAIGAPAPAFSGTTLTGETLALKDFRGRPVIVNFWGPSCIPCREEFALFIDQLHRHQAGGLALIGILMVDPPAPARDFVLQTGATWPTIDDPDGSIRAAYRAIARPQTYFIDRDGVLRGIQVGPLSEADFDRLYAEISRPAASARR